MSLHPPDDLLSAYLDGELTAEERGDVERLLAENSDGRQTLEDFRALGGELRALPRHKLDADFAQRVLRKAERQMLEAPAGGPTVPATNASPQAQPRQVTEGDERPSPAPRAVGSAERDDEVRGRRRLFRPVAWSLVTLAAALAIMFFVDPGSRDRLARNVGLNDAGPSDSVAGTGAAPGGAAGQPRISARPGLANDRDRAKVDLSATAGARSNAGAGNFQRGRAPLGGGMGGGGGFGGVSGSGELLAANAVYTVEVSADAADWDSIDSYFTGNRVAVVEDSLQAEVTRGVLRRLSGLSGAVDDTVVLWQADKRMVEQDQLAAGSTIAPQEVAYLVEGTPEQIAELVSATGAIPEPIEQAEQSFDRDRDTASGDSRQQLYTEQEFADGEQPGGQAGEEIAARRSRLPDNRGQRGSSAEKTDGPASDDSESDDALREERVPNAEEPFAPAAAATTAADSGALPGGQPSGAKARRFFVRTAREAATTDSPQVLPATDAAPPAPAAIDETAGAAAAADADPAEDAGASQEESADPGPPLPAPAEAEGERPAERPTPPPEGLGMLEGDEAAVPFREDLPRTAPRDVALDHLAEERLTEESGAGEHRVRVWFVFRVAPQPAAPAGQAPEGEAPAQPAGAPPGDPPAP